MINIIMVIIGWQHNTDTNRQLWGGDTTRIEWKTAPSYEGYQLSYIYAGKTPQKNSVRKVNKNK